MAEKQYAYEPRGGNAYIRRPMPADGKLPEGWVTELPFDMSKLMEGAQAQAEPAKAEPAKKGRAKKS